MRIPKHHISRTLMDCPNCKGLGTLVIDRDKRTPSLDVVHAQCDDCEFTPSAPAASTAPAATPTSSAATSPQPYPIHEGSGWYSLSNGTKVRGEAAALAAENALTA